MNHTARGSVDYGLYNHSSASTFSRADYSNWKTHQDQFSFSSPIVGGRFQQHDGKGRDRKVSAGANHTRRGELVGGAKPPLRPTVSQPPAVHRRDELVAPSGSSRLYANRDPVPEYYRQQQQQHGRHHHHRSKDHRESRSRTTAESTSDRKRSVSPQMERPKHSTAVNRFTSLPDDSLLLSNRTQSKKHQKKSVDLSTHTARCKTFEMEPSWPKDHVLITILASFAFFFTGQEDICQCFTCLVKIDEWGSRDDPLKRHFNANPNCKYLREQYHLDIEELCKTEFGFYSDAKQREKSFQFWPIHRQLSGSELSEAGWYYKGYDVVTQCFTCGCVNEKWKKGDDPIAIHRELSPKCSFLCNLAKSSNVIDFSQVENRRQSFKLLPESFPVGKEKLAQAGFHLISTQPVRVKCFSCELVQSEWSVGDDPIEVHQLKSPECKFLQEESETSSFPKPIMTRTQLVRTYRPMENMQTLKESLETKSEDDSNVFNAPIHLPPRHQLQRKSTDSDEACQPSSLTSEDDKLCVVCLDNERQYAIIPCGHLCVCHSCSLQLKLCPICRVPMEHILRIYDS